MKFVVNQEKLHTFKWIRLKLKQPDNELWRLGGEDIVSGLAKTTYAR